MRTLRMVSLVGILVLSACGDAGSGSAVTSPEETPTSPPTSLTFSVDLGDGSAAQEWTLTCDPLGGSHPQPEAACAALADIDPTVFDPVPPNQVCTQIFGGPETATVSGTWNGDAVDAAFARSNGCEIARWEAAVEVLGAGTAAASPT